MVVILMDNSNNEISKEMFDLIFERYSRITGKSEMILDSNEKLKKMVEDYKQQHGQDIPDAEILLDFIPFLLEKFEKENKDNEE